MYKDIHCIIFLLAKDWKQPKCSSVRDWLNKYGTFHITEHQAAVKENEMTTYLYGKISHIMLRTKARCPSVYIVCFYWGGRIEGYIAHNFVNAQTRRIQRVKGGCSPKKTESLGSKEGGRFYFNLFVPVHELSVLKIHCAIISESNNYLVISSKNQFMYSFLGEINTTKRYSTKKYFSKYNKVLKCLHRMLSLVTR